ncbi:MAG: tetratricopeptide repeat protein [Bacteroidota bacterium]
MKHLIPYFIHERHLSGERNGTFTAFTLFVDLKGFTPLTEGLMREGTSGAEELSNILNEIFDPLIRLVYARGGFIPYFAGDAFTAIFPAEDERQSAEVLIQTAAMARALFQRRENRFGNFTIGLKFGLSYGEVEWGIVGTERKSFYFRGQPIDSCAYCQTLAENQHIVVDGSLLALLSDNSLELSPVGEDAYRVVSAIEIKGFPPPLECDELSRDAALAFLPEAVVDYKQEGEFRPVVTIFLSFTGIDNHRQLDEFSEIVLQQTDTFSGYFKEIDFGDKGGVMTIFFGAPVAFENNVERALEFLMSLREQLRPVQEKQQWRFKAGMTVGTAYTGMVGGYERCQYACVGNRVNLASRLMTNAEWGEFFVDQEIQKSSSFRFLHTGNIKYKGIKGNVPTFKLLGRNFNVKPTYSGRLIARDEELVQLSQFASPLFEGKNAGLAYVFGEAGVGKSRLTFEVRKSLFEGEKVQWFVCQADQILHKPFNPFLYFLQNYFQQSPEEASFTNRANFDTRFRLLLEQLQQLESDGAELTIRELERTKPILMALVGLQTENNSLWDQLDAKGRYQNSIWSIINLFLAESQLRPLVVELEDSHWLDDSSAELLHELVRQMPHYPILLLITSRYNDEGIKPYPLPPMVAKRLQLPYLEIDLNNLPEEAVRQFAEHLLAGKISDTFHALLLRTTNNNPFYLEQILEFFTESDLLTHEAEEWNIKDENVKLSNSINAILTARIDRLSEQVRETVKAAAVIGREFEVPILSEVMRSQETFADRSNYALREEIEMAEQFQIWMAMNELRYIFRHSLLREAVYSMQLGTRLKQLHRLIAEAIEKLYAWQLETRYVDLAFHYEQAGVFDKTCEYLRKAADYARNNYQNQQALEYYEKLLQYLGAKADSADEIKTHLKRGKLLQLIGNWQESEEAFRRALQLAKSSRDVVMIGESNSDLGHLLLLRGEYDQAAHYLKIAAGLFESVDDRQGYAKVNGHLGNLHLRMGEYPEAKKSFQRSIKDGYVAGATAGGAQIVANLALTHMNLGELDEGIRVVQEQLPLHRERNDKQGMATLLVNLGIVQYDKGDYDAAGKSYEEGLELAEELGNKQLVSIAMGSLGLVIQHQGDYERAMKLFRRDHEITEELGDKQGIAIALGLIGDLLKLKGDFYPAIEYMQKNLMMCEELGYQKGIAKAVNTLGDIFYFTKEYERSLHFYDRAIEVTRKINHKTVLCASLIEKGLVLIKMRKVAELLKVEREALALARELGNPDLLFDARALEIRALHMHGRTSEALLLLDELIQMGLNTEQEAEAAYIRFRLLPVDKAAQQKATLLFRELYTATPQYLYKLRLEKLGA